MAGLTNTGITIKDVDELLSDMESQQLATIDANLNVEADSIAGQFNGVYAEALALVYELLEQIYQSAYPDTASGQSLSYVAAFSGAIRQLATKATLDVHLEGTVSTLVPAGTRCYPDGDSDSLFETVADATIVEQGTPDFVAVTIQAVTEGSATVAAHGDTLIIATPVSGLDAITTDGVGPSVTPFVAGADEETDAQLRTRREQTLALAGASTVDAIRTEILQVTGVDICTVFENPTGFTDALGLPPYSIEVLVYSETAPTYDAQELRDEILLRKPAGTETYGAISGSATDSTGNTYTIKYSTPTTVRVYTEFDIVTDSETYVGDANVAQAVADWGTAVLRVGDSIYASDIVNVVADLAGVVSVDLSTVLVDDIASPVSTDLILTARQLGTIAAADVDVTST